MSDTPTKPQAHKLSVTLWQGQALDLSWTMTDGQTHTHLAHIWRDLALNADDFAEADLCMFEGPHQASGHAWTFEHHCKTLRCSLNGKLVLPYQKLVLHTDDVLEIGLCQLRFQSVQARQVASSNAERTEPTLSVWDLTALANAKTDPLKPADTFDDLLGASAWQTEMPASDAWITTQGSPSESQLPQGHAWQTEDVPDGLPSPAPTQALENWHALYMRRLEAPYENASNEGWMGLADRHAGARVDAMSSLMTQANEGPDLSALLGQSEHISTVLNQLEDQKDPDWLAATESVNVLHLFAPPNWQPPPALADVPLINRQEHHGMAIDSAVSLSTAPPPTTTTNPSP